jgi:hypothetical protein
VSHAMCAHPAYVRRLDTSPTNISGQWHVNSGPVICSSVTCQTDEYNRSTSIFKTNEHNSNYVHWP